MGVLIRAFKMLGTLDEMATQRTEEALELAPTSAPQEVIEMLLAESEFLDDVAAVVDELIVEVRALGTMVRALEEAA